MKTRTILLTLAAALCFGNPGALLGQSTAFTYHGVLSFNRAAVTGEYDMQFAIYGVETGGTPVAGPLAKNAVGVTNGLFTVRLDFMNGVFTGPPRWIQVSVRPAGNGNFQPLNPRQELTSSPYSIRAQTAGTAGDVSSGTVVKSLNSLRDDVSLVAGANVTIAPNGNSLTISSTGANIWSPNGTNTFYNTGNVGIGNSTPVGKLDIAGAQDALRIIGPQAFLTFHDSSAGFVRGRIQSVSGELALFAENYVNGSNPSAFMKLAANGSVGIGSPSPVGKLEIVAQDALRLIGFQPFLTFYDSNAGFARGRIQGVNGDIGLTTDAYIASGGANPAAGLVVLKNITGNLGIGTAAPSADLHVFGTDTRLRLQATGANEYSATEYQTDGRTWHTGVGGSTAAGALNGKYYIYDATSGQTRLTIDTFGVTSVEVLSITGGADLSENFDVTDVANDKADAPDIEPGLVVSIDPENPGKLEISQQAYDRRVAGIISGAGGVKPGMVMGQEGSVATGKHPVALTGRVYVHADATYGAIEPGDLLTTSDTPGHAMKVTDHAKAPGAVLGKAMSALKDGKGMVLVLVTLQ